MFFLDFFSYTFPLQVITRYWIEFPVWYSRFLTIISYVQQCICSSQTPDLPLPFPDCVSECAFGCLNLFLSCAPDKVKTPWPCHSPYLFLNFLFYLESRQLTMAWEFQVNSKGPQPHIIYVSLLSPRLAPIQAATVQSSTCYTVGPCWLSILNITVCIFFFNINSFHIEKKKKRVEFFFFS